MITPSNAWEAVLDESARWKVYDRLQRKPWYDVAKWAAEQFGAREPSRQTLYNFRKRMHSQEAAHRLEIAVAARDEAGALAAASVDDDDIISACKTMGAGLALQLNDVDGAMKYMKIALAMGDQRIKKQSVEISAERLKLETCKRFIAWAQDRRAIEIASSSKSNKDKIAALLAYMDSQEK